MALVHLQHVKTPTVRVVSHKNDCLGNFTSQQSARDAITKVAHNLYATRILHGTNERNEPVAFLYEGATFLVKYTITERK